MVAAVVNNRFAAALQNYEPYQDFLDKLEAAPFATLKPTQTLAQAKKIHAERKSRDFVFKDMTGRHVEKASSGILEAMALRAELVGMQIPYTMAHALLLDYHTVLSDALRVDLRAELARDYATETDRSAAVRKAVAPAKSLSARYKTVIEVIDTLIKDLDQVYWSLKTVEEAFSRGARVESYR
jgi:hypothetical protein